MQLSLYATAGSLQGELSHCATDVVILTTGDAAVDCSIPAPSSPPGQCTEYAQPKSQDSEPSHPAHMTGGFCTVDTRHWIPVPGTTLSPGHAPQESVTPSNVSQAASTRARLNRIAYASRTHWGRPTRTPWNTYSDLTYTMDELPAHWHAVDQVQLLQPLEGNLTPRCRMRHALIRAAAAAQSLPTGFVLKPGDPTSDSTVSVLTSPPR